MSLGPCLGAHPLWSHARLFAWESRVTKIFKIIIRLGFNFKKIFKLKFYRGRIFHGSSGKNQQKPRRTGGLGTSSNQLCINNVMNVNICIYGVYKDT